MSEFARVSISELPIGSVLSTPLFDPNSRGRKLLGENIPISEEILNQMSARNVDSVLVSKKDLACIYAGRPQGNRKTVPDHEYSTTPLATKHSREIDDKIESTELQPDLPADDDPEVVRLGDTPKDRFSQEATCSEVDQRERQVEDVSELFEQLRRGDRADAESISEVCRDSIQSIISDKDLFLFLGANPYDSDYPVRHSLHVCAVATTIGVTMGLDDQSLADLGTGCLIHDVGMLLLYRPLHKLKRPLSESERLRLAEHPILAFESFAAAGLMLSPVSRIVIYQMHERCDGSGYPRGWPSEKIHWLAKLAAIADTYVALVSNRPHRRGMTPYYAMEKILNDVRNGLLDAKAARWLLQSIGLFPIGSYVQLGDGRAGRVLRANGELYTQPIVEVWNEKHQVFEPDLIDLAQETTIQIVKPLPMLPAT